jgi:hypothetical protein
MMDEKGSVSIDKEVEKENINEGSDSEEFESETDYACDESSITEHIREATEALRILYEIMAQKNKELVGFDRRFVEESIKSIELRIEHLKELDF